ncbi:MULTISPECIES: MarR family winged helix-turn-helix transcriptional regulator [Amycolatopsis]|uniref:MarR family winged helix-turn-helix transcriptional regulator n=1 Tax=Amycolatopsis TaxID=1813 RepID=UPI0007DE8E8C|nr:MULTISPECIES: MarR family transcriptional regulator [Amycolatopsis]OAP24073.1 MarR family protein [Amycolatopsis sp. M39]
MDPGKTAPDTGELASWPTGRLLAVAARLVEQRWTAVLAELGLTHTGLIVLHLLGEGPLAQRALARRCEVTDQTMSRTLERLSREEFVARAPDPAGSSRSPRPGAKCTRARSTPSGTASARSAPRSPTNSSANSWCS